MAEGWLVEAQVRDEDGEWLSLMYCAFLDDEDEAVRAVRKFIALSTGEADAGAGGVPVAEAQVGDVEALGLVTESALSFLALEPGKVARWA